MSDKATVRSVLDSVKASGRTALTAPEAKQICDAYGIPVPQEGLAKSADEAGEIASGIGFPVVMKIVSPDILHKTEAGGVVVGVESADNAPATDQTIHHNARN
jgi:acyl-CoA synthetase (NDP forming)